ncbi:MAG: hypothetical protein P0Y48_01050 [Candidatus Microbacterium phytovorans]|uniref:CobQ/CobB/MinD/ParA nucleotide binding domain-containing protein n=1 Tax=Candidatus Microbacterium phytovorans TaxID=3121374 RepID=A0AAJ5W3C8_9MICO|nr:hypothetical protein [Microbacterium sp.]WEK13832.1 MAG: hypothetical protein P0Y48_01050 [Microbacterium sp.]
MRVILAAAGDPRRWADDLRAEGADVRAVVAASAPAAAVADAASDAGAAALLAELSTADLLIIDPHPRALTSGLVAACDRFGVRIVARCARPADRRAAERFGLRMVDADAPAHEVIEPGLTVSDSGSHRGRVLVVWGPAGAPGRTTIAVGLAAELARDGRRVLLVDADSHAPSVALALGVPDEGPGFAAACRQVERGALTVAELERIAVDLGAMSLLPGINRPARWPELSADRVRAALEVCRTWADDVVVDVSASLELDEEIVSDLDGPRRNGATLGALAAADTVVAVVAADPIGVSRFVRAHGDLRGAAGSAPVHVWVNKTRRTVLGIDPQAQVRRTLDRYLGVGRASFAPFDPRAVDAALVAAQPLLRAAGRSSLTAAIRRFVGEVIEPAAPSERPRSGASRVRRRRAAGAAGR